MRDIKILKNTNNGKDYIVIQFQLEGKTYKFSPIKGGDYNKSVDLKKAERIALQISLDIENNEFDPTLAKYKPKKSSTNLAIAPKGRSASDAKRDLEECKEEIARKTICVSTWNKYVDFKRPSVSPSTIAKDYTKVKNYLGRATDANSLGAIELRNWLLKQTTPGATKKILVQLSACCNWAVKEGLMSTNPFNGMATDIKIPKAAKSKKIEAFSKEEELAIIEAFKSNRFCFKRYKTDKFKHSYYAPYVEFLFCTGCRPSEAIALQWEHISPNLKTITFKQAVVESEEGRECKAGLKTQPQRSIPTTERLRNLLHSVKPENCNPKDLVFPSPDGTWINTHNFCNREWKTILAGLGFPYRKPYSCRHSLITYALDSGLDAKDVAELVGNSAEIIYRNYASARNDLRLPE